MRRFGLVGFPLGHSFSKGWFERRFAAEGLDDWRYDLFELRSLEGLREWVGRERMAGFNVTAPHKRAVIGCLDALDEEAAGVGAVNCVTVEGGGRLVGHNTDAAAFRQTVEGECFDGAFILGTGGAARAVAYALGQLGVGCVFVSRHPELHEDAVGYDVFSASRLSPRTLIVNATPVSLSPHLLISLPPVSLSPSSLCYDLVYNPSPSPFLQQAALCGARIKDGLEMFHRQAELSWELFSEKLLNSLPT